MDNARTSPRNMIIAIAAAAALAIAGWVAVGGNATSSYQAGPSDAKHKPANWR